MKNKLYDNLLAEYQKLEIEIKQLRKEKETWQKVCAYERNKYMAYMKVYPALISEEEKLYLKDLNELAGSP